MNTTTNIWDRLTSTYYIFRAKNGLSISLEYSPQSGWQILFLSNYIMSSPLTWDLEEAKKRALTTLREHCENTLLGIDTYEGLE